MRGWYGNRHKHSLASRGIRSNGILEDIESEINNFEVTKSNTKEYPKFRDYKEFLPEIQDEIDEDKEMLLNMDLFDISCPSQYKLRELIERGERDGLIYIIVYINPQDYIDAIDYGFGDDYHGGDIDFRLDEAKLKALVEKFKNGKKVCIPSLTYDTFRNRATFSQEGHHRNQVAKMIGKEKVPVMIAYPKDERLRDISMNKMSSVIKGVVF